MTPTTLKELWKAASRAAWKARAAEAEFNKALFEANAERCVAAGYQIDYLRDDVIRPEGECLKQLKEGS